MPGLRAVLYDLDGVLIDSMQAWFRVIQRGARELGHPEVSFDRFRRTFGQGVEADRREFFPEWTLQQVADLYQRGFAEELAAVEVKEPAPRVLQVVRARGLQQAVVTNTPRPLAQRVLRDRGLDLYLDALACAGEAAEKPAPDLICLALHRLGRGAAEALYVGDSETDRAAARAAGIRMAGLGIAGELNAEHSMAGAARVRTDRRRRRPHTRSVKPLNAKHSMAGELCLQRLDELLALLD